MRLRSAALLLVSGLVAGACAGSNPAGVAMRDIAVSITLDQEQVDAGQKSTEGLPSSFNPAVADFDGIALPRDRSVRRTINRTTDVAITCAAANPNSTPRLDPTENVTAPPPVGKYRWRVTGERQILGMKIPVDMYEERLVQRATSVSPTVYSFETVQPTLAGSEIATYEVRTSGASQDINAGPARVVAGEPERGLLLRKLERFDAQGNPVAEFNFGIGLLLMPLPVRPGERFTSVAVDRSTGISMQNEGTVLGKERVDACGEPVDGWRVKGRLTRSSPRPSEPTTVAEYEYVVATQYGAMLVQEKVDRQGDPNDTVNLTASLARLDPEPLPEDES